MDLSILITFHKQKEYVSQLLDSIFSQATIYSYEVLIAIDGEDDGTLELVNTYEKKYKNIKIFKVYSDKRLLGLSRASINRLFLLEKSKGRYFCTIDGDDFFIDSNRFQTGVHFLETNPQYIAHACGRVHYYSNKNKFENIKTKIKTVDFFQSVIGEYIHVSQCIFRNIFIKGTTYFDKYFFNDRTLFRFMARHGLIHVDDTPSFAYRMGQGSIYTSQSDIHKLLFQLAANITNRQIGMRLFFEVNAAQNILNIFFKNQSQPIDNHIVDSIIFQNIPIAKDVVTALTTERLKPRVKIFFWTFPRILISPFFYFMSIKNKISIFILKK